MDERIATRTLQSVSASLPLLECFPSISCSRFTNPLVAHRPVLVARCLSRQDEPFQPHRATARYTIFVGKVQTVVRGQYQDPMHPGGLPISIETLCFSVKSEESMQTILLDQTFRSTTLSNVLAFLHHHFRKRGKRLSDLSGEPDQNANIK